ncbi:MAG TPA: chemotaxis protein CheW [bacterium]|nr:chemotaxis protein CheW [bacterium]HOL47596.1 chemotaxis protein CheW [bacterium]HPQ18721.1 chemotaxis protein CheW [bacterium]
MIEIKKYICFKLNEQLFGIPIEQIKEVVSNLEITPVIHTPDYIKGVINLRGEIVVVFDFKSLFLLKKNNSLSEKIIIVYYDNKTFGIIIDEMIGIYSSDENLSNTLPPTLSEEVKNYFSGVLIYQKKPVTIINIPNILNSEAVKRFE